MQQNKWPLFLQKRSLLIFLLLLILLCIVTTTILYSRYGEDVHKPSIPSWFVAKIYLYALAVFSDILIPIFAVCWSLLVLRFNGNSSFLSLGKIEQTITISLILAGFTYLIGFVSPDWTSKFMTGIYDAQQTFPDGPFTQTNHDYFKGSSYALDPIELISFADSLNAVLEKDKQELAGFIKTHTRPDSLDQLFASINPDHTSIKKSDIATRPEAWSDKTNTWPTSVLGSYVNARLDFLGLIKTQIEEVDGRFWSQIIMILFTTASFLIGMALSRFLSRFKGVSFWAILVCGIIPSWLVLSGIMRFFVENISLF